VLNLPTKTAGGTQLWTDYLWRDGFRVQQHAWTGHWRLLDDKDVRRGWGSKGHCCELLDELKPQPDSTADPQHVAVLLHGLLRSARCMKPMAAAARSAGFQQVIRFSYASSRQSIGTHAAALRSVLENLPANTQFSFVGHSMGSIVVRRVAGDLQREGDPHGTLDRCRSMVMLGPPNQGAAIARRLAATGLFGIVTGQGGLELGPNWEQFVQQLATPPFPFAIIAGDLSDKRLRNPLVDSSGDYLVSVAEAKLEGSEAFHVLPVIHSMLMKDERSIDLTIDFIADKAK
jgi:pimeloyl-ACP methyl ester carboxylesterase